VTLALEVIGLSKRFSAGAGSCLATNSVLREVNLELERGDVAAIVGAAGSGRSTLLLCIAGLLTADEGVVRRFGNELREAAARSTIHYLSCEQLWERGIAPDPTLHLVDLCDFPALQLGRLRRWLVERSRRGDAALVVADSVDLARHLARRILMLQEGRLQEVTRARARVAESRFVDRPFERV
jgi:ABC-type nitrate/sulfonate/bicarbonate transport system ATPase subunit